MEEEPILSQQGEEQLVQEQQVPPKSRGIPVKFAIEIASVVLLVALLGGGYLLTRQYVTSEVVPELNGGSSYTDKSDVAQNQETDGLIGTGWLPLQENTSAVKWEKATIEGKVREVIKLSVVNDGDISGIYKNITIPSDAHWFAFSFHIPEPGGSDDLLGDEIMQVRFNDRSLGSFSASTFSRGGVPRRAVELGTYLRARGLVKDYKGQSGKLSIVIRGDTSPLYKGYPEEFFEIKPPNEFYYLPTEVFITNIRFDEWSESEIPKEFRECLEALQNQTIDENDPSQWSESEIPKEFIECLEAQQNQTIDENDPSQLINRDVIMQDENDPSQLIKRDTRRLSDTKQLQLGLEIYFHVNDIFPETLEGLLSCSRCFSGGKIPTDPLDSTPYLYSVLKPSRSSYHLGVNFESPDPLPNKALDKDSDCNSITMTNCSVSGSDMFDPTTAFDGSDAKGCNGQQDRYCYDVIP